MIDSLGNYITRDGRKVTVHTITESKPDCTSFNVKGQVWREFRGKLSPRWYEIWQSNGKFRAIGDSNLDIIAKSSD